MALKHGNDSVAQWRRSFTAEPPALAHGDPRLPALDPPSAGVAPALLPRSESLPQAAARVAVWRRERLSPALVGARQLLVVANPRSMRGRVRGRSETRRGAKAGVGSCSTRWGR